MDYFSVPKIKTVIDNPSREELRELAKKDEHTTEFGSAGYIGKIRARSAKFTKNTTDDKLDQSDYKALEEVHSYLQEKSEMLQIDRIMGESEKFHCRLFVSKDYARIALGWSELLNKGTQKEKPDMVTVMLPEWPERKIIVNAEKGITFALGSDYIGEAKKSFLRMWMYLVKKKGGLGLHAGSKLIKINEKDGMPKEFGQLYFGLSATGKSTLTGHGLDLEGIERAWLVQDDVVGILGKKCIGTEGKGLFIKTEGILPEEQPELHHAVTQPSAILENVWVEKNGKVDFFNYELTSNGRAVIQRSEMENASKSIDMDRADHLFFITRNPLMPPIARLNREKAGIAFMLGESVESSAGDPGKAGQSVRVVGTNPFIVGKKGEEGNRFVELLEARPEMECFVLNTGYVGEGDGAAKVKVKDTTEIIKRVCRSEIEWAFDPELKLEIPSDFIGGKFDPRTHYPKEEFASRMDKLRQERVEWLAQFPELREEIRKEVY